MIKNITPLKRFNNEQESKYYQIIWDKNENENVDSGLHQCRYLSSWITAQGRTQLMSKMFEIIDKGGKIYYCDTDSIITDYDIEVPLKKDVKPGDFCDKKTIKFAIFANPK